MKTRGLIVLMLIAVLIISMSSIAVLEQTNDQGKIEVIILLHDHPVKSISSATVASDDGHAEKQERLEHRKEMVQDAQERFIAKSMKQGKGAKKADAKISEQDLPSLEVEQQFTYINGLSAKVAADDVERLRNDPEVRGVFIPIEYHILPEEVPSDTLGDAADGPISITLSTSVPSIGATQVKNTYGLTGQNVTVAVIDTGIDYTHDDLGNCTAVG